jgi:hypothetical protein
MHIIYAGVPRNRPVHYPLRQGSELIHSPGSYTSGPRSRAPRIGLTSGIIAPRIVAPLL